MDGSLIGVTPGLAIYVPPDEAAQRRLMAWAEKIVPGTGIATASGFGVVRDGELIAAIMYSNFRPPQVCDIGIVSTDPRWCTREVLRRAFYGPFRVWKVRRLGCITSRRNKKARRMIERLGFKMEGVARQGWPTGGDAVVYSMMPDECRWLGKEN